MACVYRDGVVTLFKYRCFFKKTVTITHTSLIMFWFVHLLACTNAAF